MAEKIDTNNDIYRLSARPFILEREGDYEGAIRIYQSAVEILSKAATTFKKMNVRKVNRKMFERQVEVHRERLAYLERLQQKGSFDGIVLPPTVLDAMEELEKEEEGHWTLSQIRRDLHKHRKNEIAAPEGDTVTPPSHLLPFLDSDSSQIPFFSTSLPSAPPITYRITHSSELVDLGVRSHWFFVKDETNTHTLYALQALWSNVEPITEAVLRRAGEFLPQIGAVSVRIRKTAGGSFRLITSTIPDIGNITEIPDREAHRKDWAPRRFEYGGRKFVWKDGREDGKGGFFKPFAWETLYETKRVWKKEGSKTGKMEDETVGARLCWGEKGGANGAAHSIHMVGGLDIQFREHLLAAQLARLVRSSYPPAKDVKGTEAVATATSLLSILEAVS
ncbi:uncharacterized protein ACLA_067080 [Aspergillus clavatus NRRL 1]|uniref:MIT domain-containing protein n=1 Tax=Aspergillus clavatus (strain ATCC 1007 / CBS 513.65 / DSM 816 / NCTC 3887 / NRRL 1 / QM 1276 / 107) TaxID=344612 RepID=A1CGJ2_ASPCL|nr:uncharacterized protein ACLA_067080 [Aspergillus clavatus NRRL 1]EAW11072.1 hypothetical protein ACLA_067080 [Aspergillus clavatus NRRL 1]